MKEKEQHDDGEGLGFRFFRERAPVVKGARSTTEGYPSRVALKTLFAIKASVRLR